jgi:ABC-2 type transport system ATP-binding protein
VNTELADAALTASNLRKSFGAVNAVVDVSLVLPRGRCLALLGPNGAGKTTTCEMLEGLIQPDGGDIKVLGRSYGTSRREILERIGVQLQETTLYKRYTVLETLQLFASFYENPLDPHDIIKKLDLVEKASAKLMELSGGQKQRVYLACALINNPEILFLDEPTTGLDPQSRRNVWEKVEALKAEGRSILLTTHYMDEAERLADVICVVDRGQVIASGTPRELVDQHCPGERVTVQFTSGRIPEGDLKKIIAERVAEFAAATLSDSGAFHLIVSESGVFLQKLARATDELGIGILTLELRRSTLEDVFIKLTGRSMRDD